MDERFGTSGELVLHWDADEGRWSGTAELGHPGTGPVGPAGPAGVVAVEEGELVLTFCYRTGALEQAAVPAVLDPRQADLLRLVATSDDLDTADGTPTRSLRATPLKASSRRALFAWCRLAEDCDQLADRPLLARFAAIELAVSTLVVRASAPVWMNLERVLEAFAAIDDLGERALRPQGADWHAGHDEVIADQVGAWCEVLARSGDPRLGGAPDRLRTALLRSWALSVPPPHPVGDPVYLGGDLARDVEGEDAGDEMVLRRSAPRRSVRLVGRVDAGDPGPSSNLPLAEDGSFVIDEVTARNHDLGVGTGRLGDGVGWIPARLPCRATSDPLRPRWLVVLDSGREVVGLGPVGCTGSGDDRRIEGWIITPPTSPGRQSIAMAAQVLPTASPRPVGLAQLLADARAAHAADDIGEDTVDRWAAIAVAWAQLGVVSRAGWALDRSDRASFRRLFGNDAHDDPAHLDVDQLASVLGWVAATPHVRWAAELDPYRPMWHLLPGAAT